MADYSVSIKETSKELSAKERIQFKDTSDAIKLDSATQVEPVIIEVDSYAVLSIHNEKAEDKDYESYIIVDKNGTRYSTGSASFFSSFMNIYSELKDETDIEWKLKVYRLPSKNRQGKDFITCSVL